MNPVNHLRQFSLGVPPCGNGWKLSCGQKSVRYLTKLDYIQPDWRVGIINPSIFIRDSDKSFFLIPVMDDRNPHTVCFDEYFSVQEVHALWLRPKRLPLLSFRF